MADHLKDSPFKSVQVEALVSRDPARRQGWWYPVSNGVELMASTD